MSGDPGAAGLRWLWGLLAADGPCGTGPANGGCGAPGAPHPVPDGYDIREGAA
jgi:hypothetical protein